MKNNDRLLQRFVQLIEKIRKKTDREPSNFTKIENIDVLEAPIDYFQDFPQRFGVRYRRKTMLISKDISEDILDGILAREAFIQFLPNAIRALPQSYDLALEFGRQHVKNEKLWLKLWHEISTPIRVEGFLYNPPLQFPTLSKASKGTFLWNFMRILYNLDDYNLKIPLNEFIHLYAEYRLFFVPKLNKKEIKFLNILLNQKRVNKQEIARQLRIPVHKVTPMITSLIEKDIIYRYVTVNFRKLGFTAYYIYYNGPVEYKERIKNIFYNNSRYQYAYHQFVDGAASFLIALLAPDSPQFFSKLLVKCERESRNTEGILMCFKRFSSKFIPSHLFNLSTYDVKTSSWKTNWFTWFVSAKRALEAMDTLSIPNSFEFAKDSFDLKQITLLDLQILDYVIGFGDLNRRKIRNYVKRSMNVIQQRIKFLEDKGIIYNRIFAKTLGLSEYTIILLNTMDMHLLNTLKALFELLPYTIFDLVTGTFSKDYSATDTLNGAVILVATPPGEAITFERYLRRLLGNYNIRIHVTTSPKRGVWKLPIDTWDDKHKKWCVS